MSLTETTVPEKLFSAEEYLEELIEGQSHIMDMMAEGRELSGLCPAHRNPVPAGKGNCIETCYHYRSKPLFHQVAIKDNGIGFAQKDADRIFQVFTRLLTGVEYKGTGVGLSIAQRVVENHNGFIMAESRPGEGALFTIYFPVD